MALVGIEVPPVNPGALNAWPQARFELLVLFPEIN